MAWSTARGIGQRAFVSIMTWQGNANTADADGLCLKHFKAAQSSVAGVWWTMHFCLTGHSTNILPPFELLGFNMIQPRFLWSLVTWRDFPSPKNCSDFFDPPFQRIHGFKSCLFLTKWKSDFRSHLDFGALNRSWKDITWQSVEQPFHLATISFPSLGSACRNPGRCDRLRLSINDDDTRKKQALARRARLEGGASLSQSEPVGVSRNQLNAFNWKSDEKVAGFIWLC